MDIWEKIIVSFFIVLMIPLTAALSYSMYQKKIINDNFGTASLNAVFDKTNNWKNVKIFSGQINSVNLHNVKLINPPEIINAVYLTSWSAASQKYIDGYLSDLIRNTEINAVVIDIKDYSGYVSYLSQSPWVIKYKTSKNIISDLPGLINKLHEKNIYVIARISTFEDPAFANARPDLAVYDTTKTTDLKNPVLWSDNNGLNWLSPASSEVWDYNISIARDALANGFDEVNFDYIRFPSDGKTKNMEIPFYDGKTPRHLIIKNFFAKIREELPGTVISADLFGQTTVNKDDLGIGQIIEDAFEYFDYVCPMIYPSHYSATFMGFKNSAEHPYEVVKYSMDTALARQVAIKNTSAKIRPWLQDFNMGAVYTTDMVKKQITATKDSLGKDYAGYLMWSPSNVYKQGALQKDIEVLPKETENTKQQTPTPTN